jgi:hypothetical protein
MSVIVSTHGVAAHMYGNNTCSVCNEPVWPPFMVWAGAETDITICGRCCDQVKDGMIVDPRTPRRNF